jgi:hypothetical protein
VVKLIANWNQDLLVWNTRKINLFSEQWVLWQEAWPTSGMTVDGQLFELPMQAHPTEESESLFSPTLPTVKARDASAEGYEAGLRRATPQISTVAKGIYDGDERITDEIPDESLMRTPSVTDSTGGARSEKQASERGQMVKTADQVVQLAFENGLKVSPAVEASLLPTPVVADQYSATMVSSQHVEGSMHSVSLAQIMHRPDLLEIAETMQTLPTPTTRDYKDGSAAHERDGVVQTDTVARAVFNSGEIQLIGTPRVSSANGHTSSQVAADAPKRRVEDQVLTTNWGKFEPAIRRWERMTRPAPAPTKPDGKDGNHRLSSEFTEWMMGLPEGWITGHGLKRNDELKMAGNGVVPQQAELALRMLLGADIPKVEWKML